MLQGACKYGDSCWYFHPKPDGVNPALAAPGKGLHFSLSSVLFTHLVVPTSMLLGAT
jgi:hypothetical protein